MNNKEIIIGLGVIAVIGTISAIVLYNENKILKKENINLRDDKMKLILNSIKENPNISDIVKKELIKLANDFKKIDIGISNEIAQTLQLLQIGQTENAIEDLVKILENLLEQKYVNDLSFKKWFKEKFKKKNIIALNDYLEYAFKKEQFINEIEYKFFLAIKTIRNKEDHTIDLTLSKHINASGLVTAIGGILKVAKAIYPNNKLNTYENI